jgi:murein DD-endopeptidase MepM/ murein hydrolase activator NlpD
MRKRLMHIVLMPGDGGEVRNLQVPSYTIKAAVVGLAVLLIVFVGSIALHVKTIRDASRLHALKVENGALREQLDEMETLTDQLAEGLEWAGQAEREARLLAGLEPVDEQTRQLGIGGPVLHLDAPTEIPAGPVRDQLQTQRHRLDALTRQVSFLKQSYSTALNTLRDCRDKLACTPTIPPILTGYSVTSGFGLRRDPFTGRRARHNGLDFSAVPGTPVITTADGVVRFVGYNGDFGLTVEIAHGDGIETVYCHLKSSDVKAGQKVIRGERIGAVGSSGRSTGPHLHYEVHKNGHPLDPKKHILTPTVIVD